jgi:5'-nucleotidase
MKILITNDDGINAKGIQMLAIALQSKHEITLVAPDRQRSASSHSITLSDPLTIKIVQVKDLNCKCFSVSGTPADCTKIAIEKLVSEEVDLVISGINDGFNLGTDILYSGTVSAAIEAAIMKVPSIAISCDGRDESFEIAIEYIGKIIDSLKIQQLQNNMVLNVNIPSVHKSQVKGIKVCKIGERNYKDVFIEIENTNEHTIYEVKGDPEDLDEMDTDVLHIKEGYITLTPLHYDLTNFKILDKVSKWF